MGMACQLQRKFGIKDFRILERNQSLGGTWLVNTCTLCARTFPPFASVADLQVRYAFYYTDAIPQIRDAAAMYPRRCTRTVLGKRQIGLLSSPSSKSSRNVSSDAPYPNPYSVSKRDADCKSTLAAMDTQHRLRNRRSGAEPRSQIPFPHRSKRGTIRHGHRSLAHLDRRQLWRKTSSLR